MSKDLLESSEELSVRHFGNLDSDHEGPDTIMALDSVVPHSRMAIKCLMKREGSSLNPHTVPGGLPAEYVRHGVCSFNNAWKTELSAVCPSSAPYI